MTKVKYFIKFYTAKAIAASKVQYKMFIYIYECSVCKIYRVKELQLIGCNWNENVQWNTKPKASNCIHFKIEIDSSVAQTKLGSSYAIKLQVNMEVVCKCVIQQAASIYDPIKFIDCNYSKRPSVLHSKSLFCMGIRRN